jgi:hypothetical protein
MADFVERYKRFLEVSLIIFCIFVIKNNVSASITENFDSYAAGTNINLQTNWTLSNAGETVSNTKYKSSPNSLKSSLGGNSSIYYNSSVTGYNEIDFSFRTPESFGSSNVYQFLCYNNATGDNLFRVQTGISPPQLIVRASSTNYTISNTISNNTWYNIKMFYDRVAGTVYAGNGIATTSVVDIAYLYKGEYCDKIYIYGPSTSGNDWYTDDIILDYGPTDNIIFINPVNESIQSLNDFYWEYNFKIKNISYWTTYEFLNVDLTFVHYTGTTPDATTTLSVLREPMNTYVPNTYYNYQITDPVSFPTQNGSYQAVIGLKGVYSNGTTDTLAYDTVTFGIATTTPITPTAWCSGLCNDIATATDFTGQIGNGVNCAFRSATCYLFSPHQYNLDQFNTQYNNFKLVFPFNTFFDLASTTKNAFASSTISNNQTIGLPNIRKTGTTTQYYIQPLLSSSTMSSFIGSSNATLFRNTISYLLYGLTAGAIFLIIW